MAQQKSEGSTVGLSGTNLTTGARGHDRGAASAPTLTILYHPELRRIGDLVRLGQLPLGHEVAVSRYHPELARPGQILGEPLADSHISRRPFQLRPLDGDGVELALGDSRTGVVAQGISVLPSASFPAEEIERGVVLELAARIVLLLHHAPGLPAQGFGTGHVTMDQVRQDYANPGKFNGYA